MSEKPLTWLEKMNIKKQALMEKASKIGADKLEGAIKSSKNIVAKSKKALSAASEAWEGESNPKSIPKENVTAKEKPDTKAQTKVQKDIKDEVKAKVGKKGKV